MTTASSTRADGGSRKKGRPRLPLSPAAAVVGKRIVHGFFIDEMMEPEQEMIVKGGTAVDDVDRCYREALPELDRILGRREVPKRDRDALDEVLVLYRHHRPRGRAPLERPTRLLADVRSRVSELVQHIATIEGRHPDHRGGEACVLSALPAPPEDPEEALALRMYVIDPRGDDRRAALDALRRVLWRAAERLRGEDLLTTRR